MTQQKKPDFDWVTQDMFDEMLEDLVFENASTLLGVPGVYEAVSEHFNNDVLQRLCKKHRKPYGEEEEEEDDED